MKSDESKNNVAINVDGDSEGIVHNNGIAHQNIINITNIHNHSPVKTEPENTPPEQKPSVTNKPTQKPTNSVYLKAQNKKLQNHLEDLKEDKKTKKLYEALLIQYLGTVIGTEEELRSELLKKLEDNPASLIQSLKICCESYAENLSKEIEQFLLLLLTQIVDKEKWLNNSLHQLDVRTRVLSELTMAARYDLQPALKHHQNLGVAGSYIFTEDLSCKEVGIDVEDNAKVVADTIALKLYKHFDDMGDLSADEMDEEEWEGVNETIKGLRMGRSPQFHRLEIDEKRAKDHPLLDPNVCMALQKFLPDLPITHFGKKAIKGETRLRSQVSLFFDMLYPTTELS